MYEGRPDDPKSLLEDSKTISLIEGESSEARADGEEVLDVLNELEQNSWSFNIHKYEDSASLTYELYGNQMETQIAGSIEFETIDEAQGYLEQNIVI